MGLEDPDRLEEGREAPEGSDTEELREYVLDKHGFKGLEGIEDEPPEDKIDGTADKNGLEPEAQVRHVERVGLDGSHSEEVRKAEGTADIDRVIVEGADPTVDPEKREVESIDPERLVIEHERGPAIESSDHDERPARAEGFERNESQIMVTQQEQSVEGPGKASPESVETSDLHRFPGEPKVEPKVDETASESSGDHSQAEVPYEEKIIRATRYSGDDGLALRITKGSIPEHEERELVEVKVTKRSEPETNYDLYMMHNPEDRRGYLDLYQIETRKGEEFAVKDIGICDESRFTQTYNRTKPTNLENTSLEASCGKIELKVDNYHATLADARFRTWEGKAILEGSVNGEGFQIVRGVDNTSLRLADRSLVTSIKEIPDGLELQYTDRHLDSREYTRYIRSESALATGELSRQHRLNFDDAGLTLERSLNLSMTSVFLQFSVENSMEALRYWNSADNRRERLVHQGDIGELVAEAALRKSEFRVLAKEKFGTPLFHGTHRSERTGADSVFERDGSFYVGMVKAFANPQTGLDEARTDVRSFESNVPRRLEIESEIGKRVSGGLAIEVFWPNKESWGAIYTDYVRYRSD